jgi:hypothetical protein
VVQFVFVESGIHTHITISQSLASVCFHDPDKDQSSLIKDKILIIFVFFVCVYVGSSGRPFS